MSHRENHEIPRTNFQQENSVAGISGLFVLKLV